MARNAASTCWVFGSLWAMSSPWTNNPRNVPPIAASNMLGIRNPGSGPIHTPHSRSYTARASSSPM